MADLIKINFIEMPKVLVVGKTLEVDWTKIHENNPIPAFWDECFRDGLFKKLEALEEYVYDPAYVGYMNMHSYTCGMLMKLGCPEPADDFKKYEIIPTTAAVGWIKGHEKDVFMSAHKLTEKALEEWGYRYNPNCRWSMEFYNCPRFTEKDEEGKVILDYYIPVVK